MLKNTIIILGGLLLVGNLLTTIFVLDKVVSFKEIQSLDGKYEALLYDEREVAIRHIEGLQEENVKLKENIDYQIALAEREKEVIRLQFMELVKGDEWCVIADIWLMDNPIDPGMGVRLPMRACAAGFNLETVSDEEAMMRLYGLFPQEGGPPEFDNIP